MTATFKSPGRRPRTERLQIYLKPGITIEKVLLDLHAACGETHRPADLFRQMLIEGFRTLVTKGEIDDVLIDLTPGLRGVVDQIMHHQSLGAGAAPVPYVPPPRPAPPPTPARAPVRAPVVADPEPEEMDLSNLMG